ncbi:hypothetical protein Droror1_Dr00016544 [Drosera rotundifolia]
MRCNGSDVFCGSQQVNDANKNLAGPNPTPSNALLKAEDSPRKVFKNDNKANIKVIGTASGAAAFGIAAVVSEKEIRQHQLAANLWSLHYTRRQSQPLVEVAWPAPSFHLGQQQTAATSRCRRSRRAPRTSTSPCQSSRTTIASFAVGKSTALAFLAGGAGGFLYLLLLQR